MKPEYSVARAVILFVGGLLASAPVTASAASGEIDSPVSFHFSDLEFAMPTDPHVWSANSGFIKHHTPARLLAPALAQVKSAIPDGIAATDAARVLKAAGAHCNKDADTIACHYRDFDIPADADGRFFSSVTWRVTVALTAGSVSNVTVERDWSERFPVS